MVSQMISCLSKSSSLFCISGSRSLIPPKTYNRGGLCRFSPGFASRRLSTVYRRKWRSACISNSGKETGGEGKVAISPTSFLSGFRKYNKKFVALLVTRRVADTWEMGSAMGMANSFVNFACLWFKVLSHQNLTFDKKKNIQLDKYGWVWTTDHHLSLLTIIPGSFVLTGLTEMVALPYLGIDVQKLSLDDKAEILFLDQGYFCQQATLLF